MNASPLRLAALALALLALASPARADLVFDFQDHRGALGATQSFSSMVSPGKYDPSFQITGKALDGTTTSPQLYVKSSGNDESGLGLASDGDREIAAGRGRAVDISIAGLKGEYNITSLRFLLGSVQAGEGYFITAGALSGPRLGSGGTDGSATLSGSNLAYNDFFIQASAGNVLVESATVTGAVPEPASLAMTALGLGAGLLGYRLKRRGAARA